MTCLCCVDFTVFKIAYLLKIKQCLTHVFHNNFAGFEEISSEINEEVFNEPSATINVVQHEDEQEITSGRTFQKKNEQVMKEVNKITLKFLSVQTGQ